MANEARMTEQIGKCIQDCMDCHRTCLETLNYCLSLGGKHAEASHLRLLLDCAQICATSADFMMRGSEYHTRTCGICAELCAACADSCQNVDPHDDFMQQCVEICRQCGNSCRAMAGMAA